MKIKRYTSYCYSGVQLLCCIHDILIKCIKLRVQHHSNVQKTNHKFVLSNSFSANVEACSGSYQSILTRGQKVIYDTKVHLQIWNCRDCWSAYIKGNIPTALLTKNAGVCFH